MRARHGASVKGCIRPMEEAGRPCPRCWAGDRGIKEKAAGLVAANEAGSPRVALRAQLPCVSTSSRKYPSGRPCRRQQQQGWANQSIALCGSVRKYRQRCGLGSKELAPSERASDGNGSKAERPHRRLCMHAYGRHTACATFLVWKGIRT